MTYFIKEIKIHLISFHNNTFEKFEGSRTSIILNPDIKHILL